MSKKALLIIDMQKGSFTPETPRYNAEQIIERINTLSNHMRNTGNVVIFIQHDGSKENEYFPKTRQWELMDELDVQSTDVIIS